MKVEFVESRVFTKRLPARLSDDSYRGLQAFLESDPLAGDVVKDCGGVRKIRWVDEERQKGKRGGIRVIYYHFQEDGTIIFLAIYAKGESDDLSTYDRKLIREYIQAEEKSRAQVREERRRARREE